MMGFVPEQGIMLTTAVEQIIREHVPYPEDVGHWANERFCQGCTGLDDTGRAIKLSASYSVFPRDEYPAHQAAVIAEWVKNSLGCR